MAEIVITIDTEEGTINANVDGEKFTDVSNVYAYCFENMDDEECVSVSLTLEPEKVSHLTKRVNISTANSKEGQEAITQGKAQYITEDKSIVKFEKINNLSEIIAKALGH